MTEEEKAEEYLTRTVCQGCRNICEGDCAYAKPVRRAFINGYHECQKEHEWHYVKDGDLPKISGRYLILNCFGEHYFTTNIAEYLEGAKLFSTFFMKDIIAWKEIVLPELPKENE